MEAYDPLPPQWWPIVTREMPMPRVPAFLPRCHHVSHACTLIVGRALSMVHMTEGLLDIVRHAIFRSWPAVGYCAEILEA
jgi:hypothetical protein